MDSLSCPHPKYVVACLWLLTDRQFIRNNRIDVETTDLKLRLSTWDVTKLHINQQLIKSKNSFNYTCAFPFPEASLSQWCKEERHDGNVRFDQSCKLKCKSKLGLGCMFQCRKEMTPTYVSLDQSCELKYKCESSLGSMAEGPRPTYVLGEVVSLGFEGRKSNAWTRKTTLLVLLFGSGKGI